MREILNYSHFIEEETREVRKLAQISQLVKGRIWCLFFFFKHTVYFIRWPNSWAYFCDSACFCERLYAVPLYRCTIINALVPYCFPFFASDWVFFFNFLFYIGYSWSTMFFFNFFFLLVGGQSLHNTVAVSTIHWHESAMDLHVFPIPIPPPTSLSTGFLWVFPVHQVRTLVSCIQPGLVICFTLDNIHVLMLFSWNIPPSPSPTESKSLFYTSVSLFLFCI